MIAACLALAVWLWAPVMPDTAAAAAAEPLARSRPDSLPMTLRAAGGIMSLSADPARPIEPAGIAFDSFGRLHVSDAALRRVVRLSPTGDLLGESGSLGDGVETLRRPGSVVSAGVLDIAVLDEENRRIVRFDLQGHVRGVPLDLDVALEAAAKRVRARSR